MKQWIINYFYHLPIAIFANIFYGFPTKKLKVIGVTGTDGKTTTTNMIYQILKSSGKKVSMVSTINAYVGGQNFDTGFHVTSPDPFLVQKFAKMAVENKDEYLVLEVTSHGLDQFRFWGIKFDVGVITNITHEHLDYHKTFENYKKVKLQLLEKAKYIVINQNLKSQINVRSSKELLFTFGLSSGDFNQKDAKLSLKIPGDYNIENALAALAVAFVLDINKQIARKAVENFDSLEGRMEEMENEKGIKIIIDFAHTPNGLEKALDTLKKEKKGKLISLIGAEGFRDVGKRAMMGEIAQKLSDVVIVTAVDPRGQLAAINKQISEGVLKAGGRKDINFFIIEDRAEAINFAINNLAKKGDTVGIFGKGHEKSINLDGYKEIPWSDREEIEKALE